MEAWIKGDLAVLRDWRFSSAVQGVWLLLAILALSASTGCSTGSTVEDPPLSFRVERFAENPLIDGGMPGLEGGLGANINGPSVIRAPAWVEQPLGEYYMYFADHHGQYIRLAYADDPRGPWTVYGPGTLRLGTSGSSGHVASPDVHLDVENRRVIMYFHGYHPDRDIQVTMVAHSPDGLNFEGVEPPLGPAYARVYFDASFAFGITRNMPDPGGLFVATHRWDRPFSLGRAVLDGMRHGAVYRHGAWMYVFYTRIGDVPESILVSAVDLSQPWVEWEAGTPTMLLEPEMGYEGAELSLSPSQTGYAPTPEHALRDPFVFEDDGKLYLFYAVAGEHGIAGAELILIQNEETR